MYFFVFNVLLSVPLVCLLWFCGSVCSCVYMRSLIVFIIESNCVYCLASSSHVKEPIGFLTCSKIATGRVAESAVSGRQAYPITPKRQHSYLSLASKVEGRASTNEQSYITFACLVHFVLPYLVIISLVWLCVLFQKL